MLALSKVICYLTLLIMVGEPAKSTKASGILKVPPEGVTILVYLVPELYAAETFRLQRQTTTNTILRRSVRMQTHACYPTL